MDQKPTAERAGWRATYHVVADCGRTASWPGQRLSDDVEKKPEAALFGLPGRTRRWSAADADAVEKAPARIISQEQFADRLLVP